MGSTPGNRTLRVPALVFWVIVALLAGAAARAADQYAGEPPPGPAPAGEASPSEAPPTGPRLRILHKPPPIGHEGRWAMWRGTEPLYQVGESVRIALYKPGGDDRALESLQVSVQCTWTNQNLAVELAETTADSNLYSGTVTVDEALAGKGPGGFSLVQASPGAATRTMARALESGGAPVLPSHDLGRFDVADLASLKTGLRAWLESGGAQTVTVAGQGLATSFLVGRSASLMYWAGTSSSEHAFVDLAALGPRDLDTTRWRSDLELLVLAGGYTVDVNDVDSRCPRSDLRGLSGPEWWARFNGTLLGYCGPGPSDEENGRVAERFTKLCAAIPPTSSKDQRSGALAKAWMRANLDRLVAGAASIDLAGTHLHQSRKRTPTLRGALFTIPAADVWGRTERADWERRTFEVRQENATGKWIEFLFHYVQRQRGGAMPQRAEFLADRCVEWVIKATQRSPDDEELRRTVRNAMEARRRYEEHVQYDGLGRARPRG